MSHFINWEGNKRQEVPELLASVPDLFTRFTTYVEPFAGSGAISYACWLERADTAKYVLNDTDPWLIAWMRDVCAQGKLEAAFVYMRKFLSVDGFKAMMELHAASVEGHGQESINTRTLAAWAYRRQVRTFHAYGHMPAKWPLLGLNKKQLASHDFFRQAEAITGDWLTCAMQHIEDPNAIIILDPPYITSWNACYYADKNISDTGEIEDPTKIYTQIRDLCVDPKRRAAIMLISNAPAILVGYLREAMPHGHTYTKTYGTCIKRNGKYLHKRTTHIIMYADAIVE